MNEIETTLISMRAKTKATEYANSRCKAVGSSDWAKYYNGFFDGYMHKEADDYTEKKILTVKHGMSMAIPMPDEDLL